MESRISDTLRRTRDGYAKALGSALLSRCIRDAEERSIRTLECYSTLNASHFYGSAGFKRIRTIEVPLTQETKFLAIHMTRTQG